VGRREGGLRPGSGRRGWSSVRKGCRLRVRVWERLFLYFSKD
jgi:hypothetical protein